MDGFPFQIDLVRTDRRKSVSIEIEGSIVRVLAPKTISDSRIRDQISKRRQWITTKLHEQVKSEKPKQREYVSGENVLYLGKNYRLKVIIDEKPSIKLKRGYLETTVTACDNDPKRTIKELVEGWYRSQAERRLQEKTVRFAGVIGVNPTSISIKNYKSRWGSCSPKGDVSLNWRIIQAPHSIIDYVVVHELCHLLEHNHSPKFWRHVERQIPNWKECREWLKVNNLILG